MYEREGECDDVYGCMVEGGGAHIYWINQDVAGNESLCQHCQQISSRGAAVFILPEECSHCQLHNIKDMRAFIKGQQDMTVIHGTPTHQSDPSKGFISNDFS